MKVPWPILAGTLLAASAAAGEASPSNPSNERPAVLLIHGLGRTSRSMSHLARRLEESGFRALPVDYASLNQPWTELADRIAKAVEAVGPSGRVYAVTHSMGGLLIRAYVRRYGASRLHRVVMLAPPNQGSEVADRLAAWPCLSSILGPSLTLLGTQTVCAVLPPAPVPFECGIIAGSVSWNPLYSTWIPGPDDGKVAVSRTMLPGMTDFRVVPSSHTWMMFDESVIRLTIRFLRHGTFEAAAAR